MLSKEYIDNTSGIRPGPNQPSFNNIVYLTWYYVYKIVNKSITSEDQSMVNTHLTLNNDEYNLYKPKNSHDNITYKMILLELLDINSPIKDMSFFRAVLGSGLLRFWDIIIYGFMFGPKYIRWIFRAFLWVPALQMIEGCLTKEKIRPHMEGSGTFSERLKNARILWWYRKKTLIKEEKNPTKTFKTWQVGNEIKQSVHMQSDGKHIAVFRLYGLRHKSWTLEITARICRKILIKKLGIDYTAIIIDKYFEDRNHPLIKMWEGYGDILKKID